MSPDPVEPEVADREVDEAVAVIELFRARARSASTLTGAGAGTLAAGLILSPVGLNLGLEGRVLGLISVTMLTLGTAAFVAASLAYIPAAKGTLFSNFALLGRANTLLEKLKKLIKAAKVLSSLSVAFFIGAVVVLTITPPSTVLVKVQVLGEAEDFASCPGLANDFEGTVHRKDLDSAEGSVGISVAGDLCLSDADWVEVFLPRNSVRFLVEG